MTGVPEAFPYLVSGGKTKISQIVKTRVDGGLASQNQVIVCPTNLLLTPVPRSTLLSVVKKGRLCKSRFSDCEVFRLSHKEIAQAGENFQIKWVISKFSRKSLTNLFLFIHSAESTYNERICGYCHIISLDYQSKGCISFHSSPVSSL